MACSGVMSSSKIEVQLPLNYSPRSYQLPFFQAMLGDKCRRAALVWHRRAGKDKTVLNFTILAMLRRVGTYYYFWPTYAQGKKGIWDGMDKTGFRYMHHFPGFEDPSAPGSLVEQRWEDDMKVRLKNGSTFQIVGTDRIDSIVGTNPVGCVFSEYSIQDPKAYDLVRPILNENGGWAVFVYTPRGRNHGYELWRAAQGDSSWYTSLLTVNDTRRDAPGEDGQPVVTQEMIERDRAEGMSDSLIEQEYYCSFEGALEGSYYGDLITRARAEGRVRAIPWDPAYPVDTAWDVGLDDVTAIGFTQTVDGKLYWIDYYEAQGVGLDHYNAILKSKPYDYRWHHAPHDIKVREWGSGQARIHQAQRMGISFRVVTKHRVEDGVQAVRRILPVSYFDEEKCARLLSALAAYRREWDGKNMTWKSQPVHDWASHPADMVRYRAFAWHELQEAVLPSRSITDWDLWGDSGPRRRVQSKIDFDPWEA